MSKDKHIEELEEIIEILETNNNNLETRFKSLLDYSNHLAETMSNLIAFSKINNNFLDFVYNMTINDVFKDEDFLKELQKYGLIETYISEIIESDDYSIQHEIKEKYLKIKLRKEKIKDILD